VRPSTGRTVLRLQLNLYLLLFSDRPLTFPREREKRGGGEKENRRVTSSPRVPALRFGGSVAPPAGPNPPREEKEEGEEEWGRRVPFASSSSPKFPLFLAAWKRKGGEGKGGEKEKTERVLRPCDLSNRRTFARVLAPPTTEGGKEGGGKKGGGEGNRVMSGFCVGMKLFSIRLYSFFISRRWPLGDPSTS